MSCLVLSPGNNEERCSLLDFCEARVQDVRERERKEGGGKEREI